MLATYLINNLEIKWFSAAVRTLDWESEDLSFILALPPPRTVQSPKTEADFDLSTAVIDQPPKPSLKQTMELAWSRRLGVGRNHGRRATGKSTQILY